VKVIFILTRSITFNTFLKSQAYFLKKRGLNVEIACSDPQNLDSKNYLKHKINFPSTKKQIFYLFNYIKIFLQIKNLVDKNPKSIFYLHTPVASHLFRLFNFFKSVKIIYFVHGFRFTSKTKYIKRIFFKIIEKILSFKTNIFITINNEDYNYAKLNLNQKAFYYKINGIGLNFVKKNLKRLRKKTIIKKILVIAAYKKEKGYLDILNLADVLRNQNIQISCYGYGCSDIFEKLKIKKNLKNIHFNKFDKKLENKIKKFDILLHLSAREGLPVAVMQSLVNGLPVICYNIRGNNDLIINNYNGYFVKSYVEAAKKIYFLNLEKNIFDNMRINAYNSIDKSFSKDQINSILFKIIKSINMYKK